MTDKPSNYELGDELLSAYLDGELSADERAAVEARLANDPAAQQLLHELRSVSQSVQAMPTESLGRDLSDDIIRRAREAKPTQATAATAKASTVEDRSRLGDTMPKITIFKSKRAWIWASLTLAAGLLLMIVQSGDESAKKLGPVAVRNKEAAQTQPVDEAGLPPRREISISAAPNSNAPSSSTVASETEVREKVDTLGGAVPATPMVGEPRGGQLSSTTRDGAAAGRPVAAASPAPKLRKEVEKTFTQLDDASNPSTASPEQVARDKRPAAPQPTGSLSGPGGAPGMSAEKQKSEAIVSPTTQRLFVVRVVAKPEALEKGSFERLLADNKIQFEPQPAKTESLSFGGGKLAKRAQIANAAEEQSNKAAESHTSKMEMVLVEAPALAIESCLADLNKNANDFVSITVNEEQQSQDRFDAKSTVAKSLAETPQNLSRFSRGAASEAQKDTIDLRKYFYSYDFGKPNDPAVNGSPRARGFGGEAGANFGVEHDANGDKKWDDKGQLDPDIRRARRIDNRQAGDFAAATGRTAPAKSIQSGAQAAKEPMSQRKPNEQPEAKSDNANNLKVLFVFTPEETSAPSTPSDNRPK